MANEEARKAAAASIAARYNLPADMKFLREIIAGENDDHPAVQAFEAFRAQIVAGERERCAKIIDDGQETTTCTAEGTHYHLTPRKAGNIAGLSYAAAIRSADHG